MSQQANDKHLYGFPNRSTLLAVLWLNNVEPNTNDLRDIALNPTDLDWQKTAKLRQYLFELLLGENSPILCESVDGFSGGLIADLVGQELEEIDYQAIIESVEE